MIICQQNGAKLSPKAQLVYRKKDEKTVDFLAQAIIQPYKMAMDAKATPSAMDVFAVAKAVTEEFKTVSKLSL